MFSSRQGNYVNESAVDTHFIWICHLVKIPDSYWTISKSNVIPNAPLPKSA